MVVVKPTLHNTYDHPKSNSVEGFLFHAVLPFFPGLLLSMNRVGSFRLN